MVLIIHASTMRLHKNILESSQVKYFAREHKLLSLLKPGLLIFRAVVEPRNRPFYSCGLRALAFERT